MEPRCVLITSFKVPSTHHTLKETNHFHLCVCVCVFLWVCVHWQVHWRLRPQLIFKAAWDHEVLSRSPLRINVTSLLVKRTCGIFFFFFPKRDSEDGESVCVSAAVTFPQPGLAYLLIPLFLICDRLHYPPVWFTEIAICFSTETVRIMQSKNSPRIRKDQRGQSSLAFLVFFHHFPLKFVTFDMLRVSICDVETAVFAYPKLTKPRRNLHITDKYQRCTSQLASHLITSATLTPTPLLLHLRQVGSPQPEIAHGVFQ